MKNTPSLFHLFHAAGDEKIKKDCRTDENGRKRRAHDDDGDSVGPQADGRTGGLARSLEMTATAVIECSAGHD